MEENKLTNSEIAKVFAMYGYGTPVMTMDGKGTILTLYPNVIEVNIAGEMHYKYFYTTKEVQLLLTPLSGITDEHAVEVKSLIADSNAVWEIDEYTTKDIAGFLLGKKLYMYSNCFQLLIIKGYAVPLWFGISHWANGKTAIELGIAIENGKL